MNNKIDSTPKKHSSPNYKPLDPAHKMKSLEKLLEVNLYLNTTPNLETLLGRIISISKDILEAYSTSIILIDEEKRELFFQKVYDSMDEKVRSDERALKRITLGMNEGIAGHVVQTGQPLIINDVQSDPRFSRKADLTTGVTTKNMIAIPLRNKEKPIGVMEVINRIEGDFSEEDLPMCLALGNVASVAIENARMYFEAEKNLKRLAKMESSKYQLVSLLFHALKTPVSSIKGYAEYVLENIEGATLPVMRDFAEITHKEATNISKMINDLYVINEYDDLIKKLNIEQLNFAEIMQVQVSRRNMLQKDVSFVFQMEGKPSLESCMVEIDYDKIEHCIQHLFDIVSSHAAPGASVHVNLFTVPATRETVPYIHLEIEDEYITIPDDLWEKVFNSFQGEGQSEIQSFEAVGLGLFITRKIIEAHGGRFGWEKKKPTGIVIQVSLPQTNSTLFS
ncbi:MAG: GAF domain-containing protein [Vulcanimicrobiota bacterium]